MASAITCGICEFKCPPKAVQAAAYCSVLKLHLMVVTAPVNCPVFKPATVEKKPVGRPRKKK